MKKHLFIGSSTDSYEIALIPRKQWDGSAEECFGTRRLAQVLQPLEDAGHGLAGTRAVVARARVPGAGGGARAVVVGATGRADSCTGR